MRRLLIVLALLTLLIAAAPSNAQVNAASCEQPAVQAAITAATQGQTVNIPAGTCTWTLGITISGKGIAVQGAGSGRIIAYDNGTELLTVGTGTKTVNIAGYSPNFSSSSISSGQTLRISQKGFRQNFMQGTVTSLSGNVLTMNITTTGGSGTAHRWLISTMPSTVIINNTTGGNGTGLFQITGDNTIHTSIGGIKIAYGTGSGGDAFDVSGANAQAVLIHDCWIEIGNGSSDTIHVSANRGVFWNLSVDASPFNSTNAAIHQPADSITTSWTSAALWGNLDTTGQGAVYVESSDFHAYNHSVDVDNNGRLVFRYNLQDNSGFATHGNDSSFIGARYFEYYNNTNTFNGYGDGTTFNLGTGWFFVRGGTYVMHDNNIAAIASQDFTKGDVDHILFDLQTTGPAGDGCWGSGVHTPGQYYPYPRQIGAGFTTGTRTANYPPAGVINSTHDAVTFIGDLEPAYLWNNNRVLSVGASDFGGNACTTPDTTSNYVVAGRDYLNNGTAKPGYTPFVYPHPLAGGQTANPPNPPTSLIASVSGSTVSLSWTASSGTPVPTGYTLYRGTVHGGPYSIIKSGLTSTSTTDTPANGTYFYVTTAFVGTLVSSISGNGTTATVTCFSTCTFSTGTVFTIAGDSQAAFNGTFSSTGQPSSSSFTFASSTNASGTGGGAWPTSNESAKSNEVQATVPATLTVSLLPSTRTFASQIVGTSSASQSVTLTNTSGAGSTVTITSKTITGANSGDFSSTDNCPSLLLSGTSCTFNITFSPTAAGSRVATLAVADNAAGNPQTVALSGTGVAQTPGVSLNPTSLNFGDQTLSTTSTVRSIILTNTGSGVLTITSVVASGDFAVVTVPVTNCGTTLASLATCSLNVTFTPTATGGRTGSVTVTDNAAGSPHVATLSGNGITTKCQMTATVTLSGLGSVCQ